MTKFAFAAIAVGFCSVALTMPASAYESVHRSQMRHYHEMHRHMQPSHHHMSHGVHSERSTATGGNPGGYSSRN